MRYGTSRKEREVAYIMASSEDSAGEPNQFRVNADPVTWTVRVSGNVTVTVTRADGIEVEGSETQKVLRLRNGDFSCFKSVYLIVDGGKA